MVWIYNGVQRRGEPWHLQVGGCRTGFNGCMQEQEETIFESAGELKVLREIRGIAENGKLLLTWTKHQECG